MYRVDFYQVGPRSERWARNYAHRPTTEDLLREVRARGIDGVEVAWSLVAAVGGEFVREGRVVGTFSVRQLAAEVAADR